MFKVLLDATKPQESSNGTTGDSHFSDANDNNQVIISVIIF